MSSLGEIHDEPSRGPGDDPPPNPIIRRHQAHRMSLMAVTIGRRRFVRFREPQRFEDACDPGTGTGAAIRCHLSSIAISES